MNTKRYLALVMALVMAFSLVVPVSAAPTVQPLVCGDTELHDTARLTVYVNNDDNPAAVGSIDSDMNAKLVLNYRDYSAASTVTVAGQTENHANQTTFTLNGSNHSGINLDESYFPGFGRLTDSNGYTIKFVDELGTSSNNYWGYTFKKSNEPNDGVTLELVTDTPDEADAHWQTLKGEAFNETHENDENSFIKLAAGSYLQMANEKLTVNSDLWLDDFSNEGRVDYNVTNAKAKLTYTTPSTTAYQLLLKEGTQFSLGCSMAEVVNQDLLITMSNVTKSYTDPILRNVYNNLTPETEEALAQNLLKVFSEIAGLARPTNAGPVVITFGTPTTSTSSSTTTPTGTGSETVEKTTTTIVTDNTAGTTDTTTVSTETVTNTSTVNNVTTTIVNSTVTETSSTVAEVATENKDELKYTVTNSGTTTTTTTTFVDGVLQEGGTQQTDSPPVAVKNVTVSTDLEDANKNLSEQGATAKVATPALDSVAEDALAAIVTKAITDAQTDSAVQSISVKIVVEAEATTNDNAEKKTYEVTPKAYTYENMNSTPARKEIITNAELATDAEFSVTLPVPDAMVELGISKVKVTHKSADYNNDTFLAKVHGSPGGYYVTFYVTHFSQFELEPVTVYTSDTEKVAANLTLQDDIAINFHVYNLTKSASYYSVHYSFNEEDEQVVQLSSIKPDDKGEYSITVANCAARQMADVVNFKLYCGDTVVYSTEDSGYSIRQYCLSKIGGTDTKLANLCNAVLNYGANAQSYFDYKINCLANEGITTDIPQSVPEKFDILDVSSVSDGIKPSANMTLRSKTELNFALNGLNTTYFTYVAVRDITSGEMIDNSRVDVVVGANKCIVTVKGIPAKYLNHVFELSYKYWDNPETIQYSPMTYAYRNQTKPIHDLGNLCRALYGYWNAAKEYLSDN